MLTDGAIFSTFEHTDPLTVCGRSTLKDGVVIERIFRCGSFRELKIAKESSDLAKVIPEPINRNVDRDLLQTTKEHLRKF